MRRSEIVAAARALSDRARAGLAQILPRLRFHRDRRTMSALLCVALGVIIGATAAVWVFPQRAFAATCTIDSSDHYNVEAVPPNQHHGTAVFSPGMYVYNITPVCIHVSSVVSQDTNNGHFVEIGWIDIKNGMPYNNDHCSLTGDGTPHLFRTHYDTNGFFCTQYSVTLTPGTRFTTGISDQNGDDVWNTSYNGTGIGTTLSTDFSLSESETNGERYGTAESASASFDGLQYMPLNGGGWIDWAAIGCYVDTDPNFGNYIHSQTWVDVQGTSNCPQS